MKLVKGVLLGQAPAFLANLRLGQKGLPGTNTVPYWALWREWIIARGCERKESTCIADARLEKHL